MTRQALLDLAALCEQATARPYYAADETALRTLNREIALAVGWVRKTPSEGRSKHPTWYHPSDCRDGYVIGDSLHGVDVWREPISYVTSIDAAMTLVAEGCFWRCGHDGDGPDPSKFRADVLQTPGVGHHFATAATPALALTAACLRALAQEF